jgi:hypothetical protein
MMPTPELHLTVARGIMATQPGTGGADLMQRLYNRLSVRDQLLCRNELALMRAAKRAEVEAEVLEYEAAQL